MKYIQIENEENKWKKEKKKKKKAHIEWNFLN